MKSYSLWKMQSGWFIGDFVPLAAKWTKGEIAIKEFPKNFIQTSYVHNNAKKYYVVLKGKLKVNGSIVEKNNIIEIDEAESSEIMALENSVVLLVVSGDKKFTRYNVGSLDRLLNVYNELYVHNEYKGGKIDFKDITVLVQGAVEKNVTPICIESIKKFLPGSKIILSTWEGTDTSKCECDEVILNKDPGNCKYRVDSLDKEFANNVNRQLISTQSGLEKVKTKYTLKIRTDMILTSNCFLNYFETFPYRTDECRLFEHKVIISDFYTRHILPCIDNFIPTPFHVSDWFFFGLTNDLCKYFLGTRKMTEEEQLDFKNVKNPERRKEYGYIWHWRFPPKQFYAIQAIERNLSDIKVNDWSDWDDGLLRKSELFIMNNFIVLDFIHHGILLPKYEMVITADNGEEKYYQLGLYTHKTYKDFYESGFSQSFDGWDDYRDDGTKFYMYRESDDEKN